MHISYLEADFPIGKLKLFADDTSLIAIDFEHSKYPIERLNGIDKHQFVEKTDHPILQKCQLQLQEYFDGKRRVFDLPLTLSGTDFQKKVWESLMTIPFGSTISYKQHAQNIHQPSAVRAVANANSRNCIPIIIPCHRVIGSNGALTGFAGGIATKEFLLKLEGNHRSLF